MSNQNQNGKFFPNQKRITTHKEFSNGKLVGAGGSMIVAYWSDVCAVAKRTGNPVCAVLWEYIFIASSKSDVSKSHKLITGLVASGDQFISGGERKNFIKTTFNPACVEMEGCAIAHTATLNKVPFIIVRCMSDMADDNVETVYSFNEDQAAAISAGFMESVIANF